MNNQIEMDIKAILARFDRSSPETLLASIASEFIRLHQSYQAVLARVAAMEELQATIDHIVAEAPELLGTELPASVEIDAAYSLPRVWGFHDLEYSETGRAFRWTGPEPRFSFRFFIDRQTPMKFVLQFSRTFAEMSLNTIRCYADGEEIKVRLIENINSFQLHGLLPPRSDKGGSLLSFICPIMRSPAELSDTSTDKRRLGVAFEFLKIDRLSDKEMEIFDVPHAASVEASESNSSSTILSDLKDGQSALQSRVGA